MFTFCTNTVQMCSEVLLKIMLVTECCVPNSSIVLNDVYGYSRMFLSEKRPNIEGRFYGIRPMFSAKQNKPYDKF
jgi:hypothetical protein